MNTSPSPTRTARVWSPGEVRALGATTDLLTAASVLRMGRTKAYQLASTGDFPVPVIRVRGRYVVPVSYLLSVLGIDATPSVPDLPSAESGASMRVARPADSTRKARS